MSTTFKWLGRIVLSAILAFLAFAAIHDIAVGEPDITTEIIVLVAIAAFVGFLLVSRLRKSTVDA